MILFKGILYGVLYGTSGITGITNSFGAFGTYRGSIGVLQGLCMGNGKSYRGFIGAPIGAPMGLQWGEIGENNLCDFCLFPNILLYVWGFWGLYYSKMAN